MPVSEQEHLDWKEKTYHRTVNILNLELAQFPGVGKYEFPEIKPVKTVPKIYQWIPFNKVLSDDYPKGKAVHFFTDDYQFERVWNKPDLYIEKLSKYVCVASPDFSTFGDMPLITQMYNHYRKHWMGAYFQSKGLTVIPTIRPCVDPYQEEWYLDGEPVGGIILISTMWSKARVNAGDTEGTETYKRIIDVLKPCKIFRYGPDDDEKIPGINVPEEGIPIWTSEWFKASKLKKRLQKKYQGKLDK